MLEDKLMVLGPERWATLHEQVRTSVSFCAAEVLSILQHCNVRRSIATSCLEKDSGVSRNTILLMFLDLDLNVL